MRVVSLILFSLYFLEVSAQTDSLKQNLERHKSLYEQGLITEEEYDMLKKKELNLIDVPKPDPLLTPQSYRGKIISGVVGLSAGIGFAAWGIYVKTQVREGTNYGHSIKEARFLFAASAISGAMGIGLSAKGANLRRKYIDAQIAGNSVSLFINF